MRVRDAEVVREDLLEVADIPEIVAREDVPVVVVPAAEWELSVGVPFSFRSLIRPFQNSCSDIPSGNEIEPHPLPSEPCESVSAEECASDAEGIAGPGLAGAQSPPAPPSPQSQQLPPCQPDQNGALPTPLPYAEPGPEPLPPAPVPLQPQQRKEQSKSQETIGWIILFFSFIFPPILHISRFVPPSSSTSTPSRANPIG